MDNVVEFKKKPEPKKEDPSIVFVRDHLVPWAVENKIDVSSSSFKHYGATIMSCIQGMLINV